MVDLARFGNGAQSTGPPAAAARRMPQQDMLQQQQLQQHQQQQQLQSIRSPEVLLVTGGYDQTLRFWDVQSGAAYRVAQHAEGQINSLASTTDKELVATGSYNRIRMYETRSGKNYHDFEFTGIGKNVTQVGFHSDARWLYSSAEDATIRIYDLQSNSPQPVKVLRNECAVNCITLHPNQTTLFFGDQDGVVHIWDLRTDWRLQYIPEKGSSIQGIDVDLEGVYLACVTSKGSCQLWSLSNAGEALKPRLQANKKNNLFQAHASYALKCRFSPDSTLLATTSADRTVKIWRTADLSLTATLSDNEQRWVWDAAFTADSQNLFTASSDGIIRLWQLEGSSGSRGSQFSGPVVRKQYHGHSKAVVAMTFRDDVVVV